MGIWKAGKLESTRAGEMGSSGVGDQKSRGDGELGSWGAGSFGKACVLQLLGPELDPQKSGKYSSHGAVQKLPVLERQRQEDL